MESDMWKRFSGSSRNALRWAAALSRSRHINGLSETSDITVSAFDLFVGLILSHPKQSEPQILLDHLRLTLGQLLPDEYTRPDQAVFEKILKTVPDRFPPISKPVSTIIDKAVSLHEELTKGNYIELKFVFAAMLEENSQLRSVLSDHCSQFGLSLPEVSLTTQSYLKSKESATEYKRILENDHPIKIRPVELPSYQADHGKDVDLSRDLVGIRAEVDAFAYLIGSRDLKPPLAIGLFGEWGSGKSFFMEAVESRIKNLTEIARKQNLPQHKVPFWKHIVQIRFNAWHYVEGELWASLVEHIFSQLKFDEDEEKDIVEKRRQHWAREITGKLEELKRLENEQEEKRKEYHKCKGEVADLEQNRKKELENLNDLKSRNISEQALDNSLSHVREALKPYIDENAVKTFHDASTSLLEAKLELQQAGTVFKRCIDNPWNVVFLIVAFILIPLIPWGLRRFDLPESISFLSGLSAFVAPFIVLLHRATAWVRNQRLSLQKAETLVQNEIEKTRKEWDTKITAAEKNVACLAKHLDENFRKQSDLTKELDELEEKRDCITSVSLTNEFIAERTGSDDYRKLLGLPALIQKDFLLLSRSVLNQNEEILKNPDKEKDTNVINRIILYIDDLDRCQDEHVIKVLQAVHLLLAFDLFVVVVAVDARWLNHALVEYYPALVNHSRNGDQPTSDDYLEKIFQIPFWVEPLNGSAKCNIVNGLLRTQMSGGRAGDNDDQGGPPIEFTDVHRKILDSIMDRNKPLSLEAADLSVSQAELDFLGSLSPLLGETPRSVKRFVNLYQLMRIIFQSPTDNISSNPSDHEILAFVLAVGDGLPGLATVLFRSIAEVDVTYTLQTVVDDLKGDNIEAERKQLNDWLNVIGRQHWKNMECGRTLLHIALAKRFLFRVGGYLEQHEDKKQDTSDDR